MQGRTGAMPGWGAALGAEGAFNVAEFVLALSGKRVDPGAAEAGQGKIPAAVRHLPRPRGQGQPALGAPNLTDNIWLYGGSQKAVTESIGDGRSGRMPAHAEFLGEAKAHLLAAYVYSLSCPIETARNQGGP